MRIERSLLILAGALALSACSERATPAAQASAQAAAVAAAPTATAPRAAMAAAAKPAIAPATLPKMVVHKSPTCGCCSLWVDHVRAAGFAVEVRDHDSLHPIKERLGVPYGKGSCHTAEVGGYVVEGHVPAADIVRMLREKPPARGLTVPGMPAGSPGMELPDGRVQPYTVELIGRDGGTRAYARHGG